MAYATQADLENYIAATAINGIASPEIDAALQSASDVADGYLRAQFELPLLDWTTDLTKYVCFIAKAEIMGFRGFKPDATMDEVFANDKREALAWLKLIAEQKVTPGVTDSSSASSPGVTSATGPKILSAPSRGFGRRVLPGGRW